MKQLKASLKQVIIFCRKVRKLVDFYQEHFGMELIGTFDKNWTVLDAGSLHIAFHKIGDQYSSGSDDKLPEDSNIKLVYEITSDLTLFRQKLLDGSVDIGEIKQFEDYPFLVCDGRDPEGNVFQLIKYLPEKE